MNTTEQIRNALQQLSAALETKLAGKSSINPYATITVFSNDGIPDVHLNLHWFRELVGGKTGKEFKAPTFGDAIVAASEWIDTAETDAQAAQRQHDQLAAVLGLNPDGSFQKKERCPDCGEPVVSLFDHVDRGPRDPVTGICTVIEETQESQHHHCVDADQESRV